MPEKYQGHASQEPQTHVFPHQLSMLLEWPWRRLVLSPQTLADPLPLTGVHRVLEVGAGSGYYSAAVAARLPPGTLTATDLQPEMLRKVRVKTPDGSSVRVRLVAADARALPFRDEAFDVMFLVTVIGEIPEPATFLRDAHRVIATRGFLSISEHLPDPDFISARRLRSMITTAGFEFVETHGRWWSYTSTFKKT